MSAYFTIESLLCITALATTTTAVINGAMLLRSFKQSEPVPWDAIVKHLEEQAKNPGHQSLRGQLEGLPPIDDLYCAQVAQLACSIRILEETRGGSGESAAERGSLKAVKVADRFS